jgi:hypothetical protein
MIVNLAAQSSNPTQGMGVKDEIDDFIWMKKLK